MIKPLSKSALIDLVAPSSPVTKEQVQKARTQIKELGFLAQFKGGGFIQKGTQKKNTQQTAPLYSTNNPELKYQALKQAILNTDSKAIWCVRGGYGSQKLLPFLFAQAKPLNFKLLIGYSDTTALHLFFNLKWGWPTWHFPVLTQLPPVTNPAHSRFKSLITGETKQISWTNLTLLNGVANKGERGHQFLNQQIKATITGGNLTLLASSVGAPWIKGDFKNKMLFLEDINEAPYRLDRSLSQILNAGLLHGVKALLLGDFIDPKSSPKEIQKTLVQFSAHLPFPVVAGCPCGHGQQKEVLPFHTPAVLNISPNGGVKLNILSGF